MVRKEMIPKPRSFARPSALLLALIMSSAIQVFACKSAGHPQRPELSQSQKQRVQEIIAAARVTSGATRARGIGVLFTCTDGQKKTAAAEMLAGELGSELYRVDLSKVISRYIGETEKNLRAVFARAEASHAVLFFDEADALFGKRSEVKDSHDRYANLELNYLLQRIESYNGIAILSIKRKRDIDEAFLRRLRFALDFCQS